MPDKLQTTDNRSKLRNREKYEVQLFAQEAGISMKQAQDLMERFGHDRETLLREAGMLVRQMG